ncbi:hypothetical protein FKP32DRAFT_1544355, partial [Trametes sanguinea]
SDEVRHLLQAFWNTKLYLIIDEYSMLAKFFLALLSRNIAIGLEGAGLDPNASFGGINVILCGDLHQFPPIARKPAEALFRPANLATDDFLQLVGRRIYEEFTTVVVLREQMRVTDLRWHEFLQRLRYGKVIEDDLRMLRTLLLTEEDPHELQANWADAALVTPRHAVRVAWNSAAVRRWCSANNLPLFKLTAEDRVNGQELSWEERYAVAGRLKTESSRKRKDLPEDLELAVGMKVMITTNIETDLDLANGTRGVITRIVLHPLERVHDATSAIVKLKYMPLFVLVKLERTRA